MTDIDTLRPEVREAVHAINHGNGVFVDSDDSIGAEKWRIVLTELLRLADECDELRTAYTSASQWRNHWRECVGRAEAELAALKSQPFRGAAHDAIDKFGNCEELSHEEMCEVVNQAVCAERELAALKARIAASERECVHRCPDCRVSHVTTLQRMVGKRVRLVVEE